MLRDLRRENNPGKLFRAKLKLLKVSGKWPALAGFNQTLDC